MVSLRAFGPLFLLILGRLYLPAKPLADNVFAIHLDPSVRAASLQVHYFITGDFGGYGGFEFQEGRENWLFIHTEQDGKAAKTFKAVVYAPGCQIVTFSVEDLQTSKREAAFQCHPLPEIELRGRFARPASVPNQKLQVEFRYLGSWSHTFFGIADGAVLTFAIIKVPVEADGSFRAAVPSFAEDPISSSARDSASFWVLLRDAETGNILAELQPPAPFSFYGHLRIATAYPEPLAFAAKWF
jgi:hypothetical protein